MVPRFGGCLSPLTAALVLSVAVVFAACGGRLVLQYVAVGGA